MRDRIGPSVDQSGLSSFFSVRGVHSQDAGEARKDEDERKRCGLLSCSHLGRQT